MEILLHPKAKHLNGGNNFGRMMIDIEKSIRLQDDWLKTVEKRSVRGNKLHNYIKLRLLALEIRLNLYQPLVSIGIKKKWFNEFQDYWTNCLGGHPLTVMDFHNLNFHYRTKSFFKSTAKLSWDSAKEHLSNWQEPNSISLLFHFVLKYALRPVWEARLPELLKPGMKVLEYGCGLAPIYRTYRSFFNHIETEWYLADIPIFPFHFIRYNYGRDKEANFICITENKMDDPLKDIKVDFDFIIIQEVFEHLDKPKFIAEYLLNRLKPGGLFYFDYINSEGKGLDTAAGKNERISTLEFLAEKLDIISGNLYTNDRNVSNCIGVKK